MPIDYPQFGTIESLVYLDDRIKLMAQTIRALAEQDEIGAFDPFAFARKAGIEIQCADLPETCSGRLRTDKGYALIELNARESRLRQRFTLCHELAHFCFWSGGPVVKERGQPVRVGPSKLKLEERLCDRIASELLMPTDAFVSIAGRKTPSYESLCELAKHFDVSVRTTIRKIDETKGHGWISASLRWNHNPNSSFVRGGTGDVRMGKVRRGYELHLRAQRKAQDAFRRAEQLLISNPGILASLGLGYVPLAMSLPGVIIWRASSPSSLPPAVIQGLVFFAL